MLDLGLRPTPAALRPARALLTPTWIGALALLVANDHWLKGSGMVPGLVTGKLSDFAGMLVAPALFAVLIGARSQRALLACHVAVGVVFAGIQVSADFADAWSALMGMFGFPWVITCDPTDLIALPFLLLSWKLLVPEMDAEAPALVPIQRTAVAGLSVFGLWSTVATSESTWVDDQDTWYEDVWGDIAINNANDFDISLYVRPLRDDLELDCEQVGSDPGRMLDPSAFGEAEHWLLPPRTNVALSFSRAHDCSAMWIGGEGVPETIVFVDDVSAYGNTWFPGQTFDPLGANSPTMAIEFPSTGGSQWIGGAMIRFVPRTEMPEQPASCEASTEESRFAWSADLPTRPARLLSVDAGVDGCFELGLQELVLGTGPDNEPLPTDHDEPYTRYLCVPEAAMPFIADEVVSFSEQWGNHGEIELSVTLLDPNTLEVLTDPSARVARYLRGGNDPQWIGPAIGRTLVAVNQVSCPWLREGEGCATVERPVELSVVGGQEFLAPGVAVSFADEDANAVHTAVLGYARQLAVVDMACAEGSLRLSYDIDFAVIDTPL